MADYSAFDSGLTRWLKKVWGKRADIKSGVNRLGRAEGCWLIYDCYNNPAESKADKRWITFQRRLHRLERHSKVVAAPQGGKAVPTTFFHFGPSLQGNEGQWRVYAHVKSPRNDHWVEPAKYLLGLMSNKRNGVAKFKVSGPGLAADRGDQLVVWTNSEEACQTVLAGLKLLAEHFGGKVPPAVKSVGDGLGWAKEPSSDHASPAIDEVYGTGTHSFGSYLAAVIYMALEQSWDGSEANYVDEVEQFFLNVGIDPLQPHVLRTMSWDDILLLAGTANRKLVSGDKVTPPLAVAKDANQPLPL